MMLKLVQIDGYFEDEVLRACARHPSAHALICAVDGESDPDEILRMMRFALDLHEAGSEVERAYREAAVAAIPTRLMATMDLSDERYLPYMSAVAIVRQMPVEVRAIRAPYAASAEFLDPVLSETWHLKPSELDDWMTDVEAIELVTWMDFLVRIERIPENGEHHA